jgi:phage recombination protein Bet
MSEIIEANNSPKLLEQMANKFGVAPNKMLKTLKATAFKGDMSDEQMIALLVVANQYNLNPWTKEIYAFPDRGGIVPVVGVDGWSRIINSDPSFDGMEFKEAEDNAWIECTIYRKDRSHPVSVREYLAECKRDQGPWKSHPRRMLRHKAMIQCARLAFGFAGIYEPDEAERIQESIAAESKRIDPRGDLSHVDSAVVDKYFGYVVDTLAQDKDETQIAADLREVDDAIQRFSQDVYIVVCDKLAKDGVISKAKYREYLKIGLDSHR